jgi:hypothetical protein
MKTFNTVEELKTFIKNNGLDYDIQSFDSEYDSWSSVLSVYYVSIEEAFNNKTYRIVLLINY